MKKYKVSETRLRSLAKTSMSKGIEIAVDTIVIGVFISFGIPPIAIAVVIEAVCFGNHYIIERLWNKVQFGRKIEMEKSE